MHKGPLRFIKEVVAVIARIGGGCCYQTRNGTGCCVTEKNRIECCCLSEEYGEATGARAKTEKAAAAARARMRGTTVVGPKKGKKC